MSERLPDWTAVMTRLEAVEGRNGGLCRQNRMLKAVGALGVLVIGALLLTAAATDQQAEVKAERFVLVDAQGHGRALMTTTVNTGEPTLTLYDTKGKIRVSLDVAEDGPRLLFLDGNGNLDAQLAVSSHARTLFLMDENGKLRAALEVSKDGARLSLRDEEGETVWSAPQ